MGSSSSIVAFKDQDFESIKAECLESETLFEDPEFPLDDSSIQVKNPDGSLYQFGGELVWKRASELCDNPQLIVDGATRLDVNQGECGSCWFLAAMANVADHPDLLKKVLPEDQSFEEGDYTGAFHVRFWQYGEWFDVVIDDYLPTVDGNLCFNQSDDPNELWPALVEKAFAKLHGNYGEIEGGLPREAMVDLSGGCVEAFNTQAVPENLFEIMYKAGQKGSMMSCGTPGLDEGETNETGLVPGHAYSITKVIKLEADGEEHQLIRVRNPWGNASEWNGDWSDEKIRALPEEVKAEHEIVDEDDGEFYMSINDLLKNCDIISICHLDIQSEGLFEGSVLGMWTTGISAGGSEDLSANPQFKVTLEDADADEDSMATVIISLLHKGARSTIEAKGAIGFAFYRIDDSTALPLDADFVADPDNEVAGISFNTGYRTEVKRFKVEPGTFVIIPFTYKAEVEAEFFLRVFAESQPLLEFL